MLEWAMLVQFALAATGSAERAEAKACVRASTRGQELRDAGDLLGARSEFRACAAESCPQAIRSDCAQSLVDVQQAIPSIVVVVREGQADVPDAQVAVDGVTIPMEGRPVELNPGPHRLAATRGGLDKTASLIVSAGEKHRLVVIPWSPLAAPPVPTPAPAAVATAPTQSVERPRSLVGPLSLAGVGIAGLVVFTAVGAWGHNELNQIVGSSCGRSATCPPGTTDPVRTKYVIADAGLGAAVAALVGATVWYFVPAPSAISVSTNGRSIAVGGHLDF